ncbi:hypothetical protein PQU92_11510 [Asticcacaulis sp. BYS171W]|uniref:Uncharacterized protein n=1 Tax=Asticcacaulis aquaticus TaxID=2984212 RepID=A0ABT5HV03_9CAUL|nr:hypothetical protein [Asticcacaulis aquaticus]MDC7683906.1 hypothetical protein [Asticcacaulis aquaticus]
MTTETVSVNKRRGGLRVLLMAGLGVQAWALVMGVGIIVLNIAR